MSALPRVPRAEMHWDTLVASYGPSLQPLPTNWPPRVTKRRAGLCGGVTDAGPLPYPGFVRVEWCNNPKAAEECQWRQDTYNPPRRAPSTRPLKRKVKLIVYCRWFTTRPTPDPCDSERYCSSGLELCQAASERLKLMELLLHLLCPFSSADWCSELRAGWLVVGGAKLSQKVPEVEPLSAVQQQETVRGGSLRRESVFFWRVGLKPCWVDTALWQVWAQLQVWRGQQVVNYQFLSPSKVGGWKRKKGWQKGHWILA